MPDINVAKKDRSVLSIQTICYLFIVKMKSHSKITKTSTKIYMKI